MIGHDELIPASHSRRSWIASAVWRSGVAVTTLVLTTPMSGDSPALAHSNRDLVAKTVMRSTVGRSLRPGANPASPISTTVTVQTPFGPERLDVAVRGDMLVYDGDIVLGRVQDLDNSDSVLGTGEKFLGHRWPDGQVRYFLDSSVGSSVAQKFEDAVSHIESRLPMIRFVETFQIPIVPTLSPIQGTIIVKQLSGDCCVNEEDKVCDTSYSSDIGMDPFSQTLALCWDHTKGVYIHELGHALGLWHEQSRPDRDTYVSINTQCIAGDNEGQYSKLSWSDALALEPYDFGSIMHYDSSTYCKKINSQNNSPCVCQPMTVAPGATCPNSICSGTNTINAQGSSLSPGDINSLTRMYGRALSGDREGDRFGTALAAGDFDGDGYDDLAVGVPYEGASAGSSSRPGAVLIYKGLGLVVTKDGADDDVTLVPYRKLTQTGLGSNENDDQFGKSLAVGDFNGDGRDDLAVGAPGERPGTEPEDSGAVYLFKGTSAGLLTPWKDIDQENLGLGVNDTNDRFGSQLASGNIDGDSYDDLVIGADGEEAPSAPTNSGAVFLLRGSSIGLKKQWPVLDRAALGPPKQNERIPWGLAVGDTNGDGRDEIAVGAGHQSVQDAGTVLLFKGTTSGPMPWDEITQEPLGDADEFDYFGNSISIGDVNNDGLGDLAVGVPGEDGFSGKVQLYVGKPNSAPEPWFKMNSEDLGLVESGDEFGNSVVIADFNGDGYGDLAVGAPWERPPGTNNATGWVYVYKGKSSGLEPWIGFGQDPLEDDESGDQFGVAMVAGRFDSGGQRDLVVASPFEDVTWQGEISFHAGAVLVFEGSSSGPSPWQLLLQTTHSPNAED